MRVLFILMLVSGPALTLPALARPLEVCVLEQEYVSSAEHEGPGQYLVRAAAREQGNIVNFTGAPWRRCITGVGSGQFDAVIGAGANPTFAPFMSFPRKDGKPDPAAALGSAAHVVLRRIGSKANWDGTQFYALDGKVHFPASTAIVSEKLAALRIDGNDSVKTAAQLMQMLLHHRVSLVVLRKSEADILLKQAQYSDKIEMLAQPFAIAYAYLGVRKAFFEAQPAYVQGLWSSIARTRASSNWKYTEQQRMASAAAWPPRQP